MQELERIAQGVRSKEAFVEFIGALVQDLRNNTNAWENKSLDDYLDAMQRWTEDIDGYYLNQNLPVPQNEDWKVFADILMAARVYE